MSSLALFAPLATGAVTTAGWVLSARATRRLRHQLRTDRLTGLANRDGLIDRFTRATRHDSETAVGVLLLDLNEFKQINDTYGHAAGNAVLRHVADRLTGCAGRSGGFPVRLHGDEFAVLLAGLPAGGAGMAAARVHTERYAAAVHTPLLWAGHKITPSASVGAATAPTARAELSVLLRAADQRMYADKHALPRSVHRAEHVCEPRRSGADPGRGLR